MGRLGDKIKGKASEVTGTVTGDRKQEMKGKAQQAKGAVVDKGEQLRRDVDEGLDDAGPDDETSDETDA